MVASVSEDWLIVASAPSAVFHLQKSVGLNRVRIQHFDLAGTRVVARVSKPVSVSPPDVISLFCLST
jgi:hypothetical protein